jgi:rod shape-determining protein MreD
MNAIRSTLVLLASLAVALVVDGLANRLTHGRVLDPYLIVVVAFASRGGKVRAMVAGGLAGFVQDLVASAVFGVHYLGKLVVGYAASLLTGRLIPGQALTAAVLLGGGTVLEKIVFALLGPLLGSDFTSGGMGQVALEAAANIVVGMIVFRFMDRLARRKAGPGGSRGR